MLQNFCIIFFYTSQTRANANESMQPLTQRVQLVRVVNINRLLNLSVDELSALKLLEAAGWARRLSECFSPLAEDATSVLQSLTDLATYYFNNVALAGCMSLVFSMARAQPRKSVEPLREEYT